MKLKHPGCASPPSSTGLSPLAITSYSCEPRRPFPGLADLRYLPCYASTRSSMWEQEESVPRHPLMLNPMSPTLYQDVVSGRPRRDRGTSPLAHESRGHYLAARRLVSGRKRPSQAAPSTLDSPMPRGP
ncbi:hypothetical protein VNO77_34969 [Canavalia gladiata]|uniref:Uncharacterized protein n=1 Tax=Canavalia gladiata TaxID=3824 RepID=A0AAN9KES1_CANGL